MPIYTPWKKSRTLGDIYGGREKLKCSDNIFARCHSLKRPSKYETLPIIMHDNPSRDFFFPLSPDETLKALKALPKRDYEGISHIWLRRVKKSDFIEGLSPLAWFCCGSGVRAIVLFPWPNDMILNYGPTRPSNRTINEFERFGAKLQQTGKNWVSKWTLDGIRNFYIQGILYHEVGHHLDTYMNSRGYNEAEEFADQYALAKTATATHIFNRLNNERST